MVNTEEKGPYWYSSCSESDRELFPCFLLCLFALPAFSVFPGAWCQPQASAGPLASLAAPGQPAVLTREAPFAPLLSLNVRAYRPLGLRLLDIAWFAKGLESAYCGNPPSLSPLLVPTILVVNKRADPQNKRSGLELISFFFLQDSVWKARFLKFLKIDIYWHIV